MLLTIDIGNTIHSIQSGIIYGYTGLVEHIVDKIRKEIKGELKVIATGGLSDVMVNECTCFDNVDPWLTLEGLRLIYNRANRS